MAAQLLGTEKGGFIYIFPFHLHLNIVEADQMIPYEVSLQSK